MKPPLTLNRYAYHQNLNWPIIDEWWGFEQDAYILSYSMQWYEGEMHPRPITESYKMFQGPVTSHLTKEEFYDRLNEALGL